MINSCFYNENITDVHKSVVFASDYPNMFGKGFPHFLPAEKGFGNGLSFKGITKKVNRDGDIEYVRYRQCNGCLDLIVYND